MTDLTLDEYKNLSEDELEHRLRAEKRKMLNPNYIEKDLKSLLSKKNPDFMAPQ